MWEPGGELWKETAYLRPEVPSKAVHGDPPPILYSEVHSKKSCQVYLEGLHFWQYIVILDLVGLK